MTRPMASNVSTLSSCVANSHQAIHLVSSAPSKIPYGGFSPVRLQTDVRSGHLRAGPALIGRHGWSVQAGLDASRSPSLRPGGTPPSHPQTASPVALGSPARFALRPAHRLLWPHPSLCGSASAYGLFPMRSEPQRFPNLLRASFGSCRTPYPGGFPGCSRLLLPQRSKSSPSPDGLDIRNVCRFSEPRVCLTRLQVSLYVTTRIFASPAPPGHLRPSFHRSRSLYRGVGYD